MDGIWKNNSGTTTTLSQEREDEMKKKLYEANRYWNEIPISLEQA